MSKKKAARGANESGGNGHNGGTAIAAYNIAQNQPRCQLPHFCDNLLRQSEQRMAMDPSRYAVHFAIWTSLYFLKNHWPWPEVRDAN